LALGAGVALIALGAGLGALLGDRELLRRRFLLHDRLDLFLGIGLERNGGLARGGLTRIAEGGDVARALRGGSAGRSGSRSAARQRRQGLAAQEALRDDARRR